MKKIINIIMTIGVLLIVGTAGASDTGNIEFKQMANQILIGISIIIFSIILKKFVVIIETYKKTLYKRNSQLKTIPYFGNVK